MRCKTPANPLGGVLAIASALALIAVSPSCGGGGGGRTVPFRINAISPNDAATDVPVTTTVDVTFSRSVLQSTVQNGVTFSLTDISFPGSPLAGTFSFNRTGRVASFTPSAPLALGTTYQVDVTGGIQDTSGNPLEMLENLVLVPTSFETQFVANLVPPTFAGAVSATTVNGSSIQVDWNPASDDVDPSSAIVYNVYASPISGGQDLATPDVTSPAGAISQVVGGLQSSTTYYFIVRAMDTSFNEDTNLVEVSAPTSGGGDATPPAFGGAVAATALGTTRIRIDWNPATDNVDPPSALIYNVYMATVPGGQAFAVPSFTSAAGAGALVATGLQPSTTYYFVARAEDTSGNIDANRVEVSARTASGGDVTPPTFAGALTGTALDTSSVRIDWNPAADDTDPPSAIVYNLYVANVPGGQNFAFPDGTTSPGVTSEILTGLSPDVGYYVVVRAQDRAGNEDANRVEVRTRPVVSFNTRVLPILIPQCAAGKCHEPPNPKKNVDLSSYAATAATCINVPAGQASALDQIEPGDSLASYLMHKIDGTQGTVGGRGGQMAVATQAEAEIIRAWIDQGALDN